MPPDETAPAGESSPQAPPSREFSQPTGVKDDAIWSKHFGKDAKASPGKTDGKSASGKGKDAPTPKPSSKTGTPERSSSSSESRSASASEDGDKDKSSTSKESKSKASDSSKTDKDHTKTEKAKPGSEQTEKADKTGGKSAQTAEESEPGESASAKDLYAKAKAATDKREQRRLYREAMQSAFGEVPDEFNDGKIQAFREWRDKEQAKVAEASKKLDGRLNQAVEELKPAITVMRELAAAKLADKLTLPMVQRSIEVMRCLRDLEDGDFTSLGELVSKASGKGVDEALKLFVRGTKVTPEGKAARALAKAAEERAAQAEQRIADLERKLTEKEQVTTQAEAERAARARHSAFVEEITADLDDHPVLKLKNGAERVARYLIRTADKVLKTPRYSYEEAADRVVAAEKKRVAEARFLIDGEGDGAPEPRAAGGGGGSNVPRRETREGGLRSEAPDQAFERIFNKHMRPRR
jgi:hypothetical protein